MNKIEQLSKFITAHPIITVGALLVLDGWVSSLLKGIFGKKEAVIDAEFEVKGDDK